MIKNRLLLAIAMTVLLAKAIYSQEFHFTLQTGMAWYSMKDLKKLNAECQALTPFETKLTSDFPVTIQWGAQAAVRLLPYYFLGIRYTFNSTGSRVTESDYSGSYYFDQVVNGHTAGMINRFRFFNFGTVQLNVETNFGLVYSILKLNENLAITDTLFTDSEKYTSISMFLEPRLHTSFEWKYLRAGIYFGYFIDPWSTVVNTDKHEFEEKVSWTGFRFGIEIGVSTKAKRMKVTKDLR
jgi:hypothetical protein